MLNIFLLSLLTFLISASSQPAEAQQPKKVARIGFLVAGSRSASISRLEALQQGLRELGYVEGHNIIIEARFAEGKVERVPEFAAALIRLKVDVIVTGGTRDTQAAKEVTNTIPIIMTQDGDPVGSGFVASLARPGGNITGLSTLSPELSGKRLELLKEVVPKLALVAVLWDPTLPGSAIGFKETETAARSLRVKLQSLEVRALGDYGDAFQAVTKGRAGALMILGSPLSIKYMTPIVDFAAKSRLPATYNRKDYVDAGGLMSYGPDLPDLARRAATYVDKILKGAKPAELPVEQPTKFELVINLKTAKQIGVTIPQSVLYRADRVIR